jgi:hypothetical protein
MNDMRTTVPIGFLILGVLALTGCDRPIDAESGPIKVELRQEDGVYRVYRGGEPFFIRGAGLERQPPGAGSIELLAEHGANALRTWRTDEAGTTGQDILDEAHANGLAVMMGLEIARERPGQGVGVFGFDYNDSVAVAAQLEQVRAEVMKYKDHPALLVWGIGNELNLRATNPRVWNAVNDISRMIHEVDPNHLTTTSLAGISKELVDQIKERAPDLDLLSIQMYGDLPNLPRYIDETGWDGAYMVTEWGATGHWEVALTQVQRRDRFGHDTVRRFICFPVGTETGAHSNLVRHLPFDRRGNGDCRRDALYLERHLAGQSFAKARIRDA